MSVSTLSDRTAFDNAVKESSLLVVHFYADWVDQCQHMNNVLEEMSSQPDYKNIKFVKMPAEEVPEISHMFKITSVPTFVLLKSGKEVSRVDGANPSALTEKLQSMAGMTALPTRAEIPPKTTDLNTRLKELINSSPVMLFMKGNAVEPRCGFSRQMIEILNKEGFQYKTFDILSDNDVREGLKKYSKWPTYPQLYINGELLGGLDIIKEMVESGELQKMLPSNLSLNERLKALINKSKVMLFMKGDRNTPRCGFSRQIIEILKETGSQFETFDILEDEDVRQGLKTYSNWPTYPQLYIKGDLIGGLDIVKELNASGELKNMLEE